MPSAEYLAQFGITVIRDALAEDCRDAVRAAMDAAVVARGMVWNPTSGDTLVSTKQRTELIGLPTVLHDEVVRHVAAHRETLGSWFGTELIALQPPKFVRYDTGDFYGAHNDTTQHAAAPPEVRDRRVSVVLFLNDQVEVPEDGCYCGGRLTFHGLIDEPPWNLTGHPLEAEAGMLVAFRPQIIHQVTPVTAGSRYTVVSWFT